MTKKKSPCVNSVVPPTFCPCIYCAQDRHRRDAAAGLSLCLGCGCMTKDVRAVENERQIIVCGKCAEEKKTEARQ